MNVTRSAVLSGIATGVASVVWRRAALSKEPMPIVRVGYIPAEVAAESFFGVDMGFFKKAGLEVALEAFVSPGAIASALVGGAIDVGLHDIAGMIAAHAHGVPLVYLATGQLFDERAPVYGTIVKADSPIVNARDFKGAFGVSSVNNIAALGTLAWIDKNGGDSKRVKFTELPFPTMTDAVARGTIDGAVPTEPWLASANERGLRTILPHNGIARSYVLSG